jgi:hypothetical protein
LGLLYIKLLLAIICSWERHQFKFFRKQLKVITARNLIIYNAAIELKASY